MAPRRWPALSVRHLPSSRRCGGLGPAGRVGAEGESGAGTEAEEAEPPWEASGSDRRGLCSGGEKRKSHGGAPGALRTGARRAGASLGPSGCRAQRGRRTACGQKPREHRAAGGEGQAGVRARERGRPQGRRAAGQCWHGEGGAIGTRAGGRVAGRGGLVAAAAGVGARLAGGEVFGSHAGGVLEEDKGKRDRKSVV